MLFEKFRSKLGKFKQAEVMKLFKNVDKNNDRKLDFKEFVEIVNTFDNEIDPTDKRILYDFLDVDEDGKISSAEFFGRLYPSFYEV